MEVKMKSFHECWRESRHRIGQTGDWLAVAHCLEKYQDELRWPGTDKPLPKTARRCASVKYITMKMKDYLPSWNTRCCCIPLPLQKLEGKALQLRSKHIQALYLLYACDVLPVKDDAAKTVFYKACIDVDLSRSLFTVYENGAIQWTGAWTSMDLIGSSTSTTSLESTHMGRDIGYLSPRVGRWKQDPE